MVLEKEISIYDHDAVINEGKKEATNYLYYDSTNGLVISRNHAINDASGVTGLTDGNIRLTGAGMAVYNGQTKVADYGSTSTIGPSNSYNTYITDSAVLLRNKTAVMSEFTGKKTTIGNPESDNTWVTIESGGFDTFTKVGSTKTNIFHAGAVTANSGSAVDISTVSYTAEQTLGDHSMTKTISNAKGVNSVILHLNNGTTSPTTDYTTTVSGNNISITIRYYNGNHETSWVKTIEVLYYSTTYTPENGFYFSLGTRTASSQIGAYSMVVGGSNEASAGYSYALGTSNHAKGRCSMAVGWRNTTSGYYSFALGDNNVASGGYSTAIGEGLSVTKDHQFAVGKYNNPSAYSMTSSNYAIFMVGNGTSSSKRNAFTVYADGSCVCTEPYLAAHVANLGDVMNLATVKSGTITWTSISKTDYGSYFRTVSEVKVLNLNFECSSTFNSFQHICTVSTSPLNDVNVNILPNEGTTNPYIKIDTSGRVYLAGYNGSLAKGIRALITFA